jgi:hypothetical protein
MLELHQEGSADLIDSLLSPAFVAASLASTGIATISLLGTGMGDSLWSSAGSHITIGMVVALFALGVAFITNEPDWDDLQGVEAGIPVAGAVLVMATGLVPPLNDVLTSEPVFGIPVVVIESATFYYVAYK